MKPTWHDSERRLRGGCYGAAVAYVYLLHFDAPLEQFQHYTGSCEDLARRLDQHAKGKAAQLTRRFAVAGIAFSVGAVWEHATRLEARRAEIRVKRGGAAKRCCGICRGLREDATGADIAEAGVKRKRAK